MPAKSTAGRKYCSVSPGSPARPDPATERWPADATFARAGLLLVAHGSRRNDRRAEATVRRHAQAVQERGVFAEVAPATLFGGIGPAAAIEGFRSHLVFVVPMFMSDSKYVRSMIPDALEGARDPNGRRRSVHVCRPIGLDPHIAGLAAERAAHSFGERNIAPADGTVLLIGHGSSSGPESRRATEAQAARVARSGRFAAVGTAYLEEEPRLPAALTAVSGPAGVIALFAAAGLHAGEDIAAAVRTHAGPGVAYLGAIGEDDGIADVVLGCTRAALRPSAGLDAAPAPDGHTTGEPYPQLYGTGPDKAITSPSSMARSVLGPP